MGRAGKPFKVDTEPTKEVVVDGLTRDVSVDACLFDLIDNSIDAARDTIFADRSPEDRRQLADSYAGFEINLTLSGNGFKIDDNCGGIPVDALKTMVLRFGKRSSHQMGIGVFGVGLNRALFKLGKVSHLKTDTGKQRAELILKTEDYLKSDNWELPAEEFQSTGKSGTEIEVRQLPSDIAKSFADKSWVEARRQDIAQRYGRFIAKGLEIKVGGVPVRNAEIHIREDSPYEGEYKFYKAENGVSIHVEYGQHRDHRFTEERDYDRERNAGITDEFGWTVLCNDRAILVADKTYKTGWETFHTEFYGFVGVVNFVGDPGKLPWTTTKTDVDLNNLAYQTALDDMRKFGQKWRAQAERRKKPTSSPPRPMPPKKKAGPTPSKGRKTPVKKTQPPVRKPDHNQFREVLPQDIDERWCVDKHLTLVHEAKKLDGGDFSYTGLALLRMLFESSVSMYLHRVKKYEDLKTFAVAQRKSKGTKIPDEKKVLPSLDEMLIFLDKNPEVLSPKQNQLKHVVKKMSAHQQTLNAVLHNPFQPIHKTAIFEIRDEILSLLRHLIETGPEG